MERTLNVLVLGVGGNVSQSIQKALALSSLPVRVVAACISADAPGLYVADRAYISPLAESPDFVPWLLDVCQREGIEAVLSGSELVLEALALAAPRVQEITGAVTIVSPPEVLQRGRDKLETCRWLEAEGLPVPEYAHLADPDQVSRLVQRCGFPLIAKPRFGKGSDAILTIRDERHLAEVVEATEMVLDRPSTEMLLQEHVGSDREEFTAGCFCDSAGRLGGTIVMRRTLHLGTTGAAELGRFPEVRAVAGAIVSALGPLGPCNVQLRVRDGQPVPLEINPRFSGTTSVRARMGFNEVEAALRHFILGEPAPPLHDVGTGYALRYWNELYVPAEAVDTAGREGRLEDPGAHSVMVENWGSGR
jgi:carbamoyl-phosphate synthase large subunit